MFPRGSIRAKAVRRSVARACRSTRPRFLRCFEEHGALESFPSRFQLQKKRYVRRRSGHVLCCTYIRSASFFFALMLVKATVNVLSYCKCFYGAVTAAKRIYVRSP